MITVKKTFRADSEVRILNYDGKTYYRGIKHGSFATNQTPAEYSVEGTGQITPDDTHTLVADGDFEITLNADDSVFCTDGSIYNSAVPTA